MNRVKVFDGVLLQQQIGGIFWLVVINVMYLLFGCFFSYAPFHIIARYIIIENMLVTCLLLHNFMITRGDMKLELITEKIVYYPTTRYQFLWDKYVKVLKLTLIQLVLTGLCFVFANLVAKGAMNLKNLWGYCMLVLISCLIASGIALITMHFFSMGIYLSLFLAFPLWFLGKVTENVVVNNHITLMNLSLITGSALLVLGIIWFVMLWIAGIVYERII